MVISSPISILVNPIEVSAAADNNRIDSSYYHSTPQLPKASSSMPTTAAPTISSQDGDFNTQAALSLTRATQTNNLVNTKLTTIYLSEQQLQA